MFLFNYCSSGLRECHNTMGKEKLNRHSEKSAIFQSVLVGIFSLVLFPDQFHQGCSFLLLYWCRYFPEIARSHICR